MSYNRKYSDADIERMRSTSIAEVLRYLGYDVRHTSRNLYYSPFRNERTPSFHIDDNEHAWFDHGNTDPGQRNGGDIFHLLERLKGWTFRQACEFLNEFHPEIGVSRENDLIYTEGQKTRKTWKRRVVNFDKNFDERLLSYALDVRRISRHILSKYCWNATYITYQPDNPGSKQYMDTAIGFSNINGEWALRWPAEDKKQGKVATEQDYTVITANGMMMQKQELESEFFKPTSERVMVFEGFFDFLSYLEWNHRDIPLKGEAVVLNSVSNSVKSLGYLSRFKEVCGYLDNDQAGDKYTEFLRSELEKAGVTFLDMRSRFVKFGKDINEAWQKRMADHDLAVLKAKQEQCRRAEETKDKACAERAGLHK